MTNDERQLVVMMRADEAMHDAPDLTGLIVIASAIDTTDGSTCTHSAVRGNRHAVIGAVEEWLRKTRAYDEGYSGEDGRYDAVVHRQRRQDRQ
jgi:hypothetical protein